ncbi:MAG: hypothetical protein AB7F76_00805 [Parvibaculaceae bacterium]
MSIALASRTIGVSAIAGLCLPALLASAHAEDTGYSTRERMENMQPGERYTFIAGIVEGIAFHRYTAGNKDADAMHCVYDWFYKGHNGHDTIDVIYAAFGEYPDYPPAAIIAALSKRKCPE